MTESHALLLVARTGFLVNPQNGSLKSHYFFLPLPLFFDALFFAALGLLSERPLADLAAFAPAPASPSPASSVLAFFGFAAGRSGAVKRPPSKAISVILTEVNGWRWP